MIVYELKQNPKRFCSFTPVDPSHRTMYHHFDGTSAKSTWTEHQIRAADEPDDEALLPDFALLGVVPVFSEQAVEVLREMLEGNGELLPLRHARRRYFAHNVTTVIDGLDEQRSIMERFTDGGVMAIESYTFKPATLSGAKIFKIPQLPRAHVYVTDSFIEPVRRAELLGFVFRELWRHDTMQ